MYLSGDAGFSANSATSATTTFSITLSSFNVEKDAVWRCTITDADSQTAPVDIPVIALENSYF
jgi:hypothetical protein